MTEERALRNKLQDRLGLPATIASLVWGPGLALLSFFRDSSPTVVLAILLVWAVMLIALLLVRGRRTSQTASSDVSHPIPPVDDADRAKNAIVECIPEAESIAAFLMNTLFAGRSAESLRAIDADHFLRSYRRDFDVAAHDIETREHYVAVNMGDSETLGPPIVSYGGSMANFGDLNAEAWHIDGDREHRVALRVEVDDERFKLLRATLKHPIPRGHDFELRYNDRWEGAMLWGFDAVFFTPTLYFARGMHKLESTIRFPRSEDVAYVRAYRYDVEQGICDLAEQQPELEETADWSNFHWHVDKPPNTMLYFVCFDRQPAE